MTPDANNPTPHPTPARPNEWSDEWLSAYVDGELTADQRAAVEARLASDPAARKVVDEFRRLSEEFAGLPTSPAPPGLAEGVAERITPSQRYPDQNHRSQRSPLRRWGWAAAAVAASLAIVLLNNRPEVGPIAKHEAEATQDDKVPAAAGRPDVEAIVLTAPAVESDRTSFADANVAPSAARSRSATADEPPLAEPPPVMLVSAPPPVVVRLGIESNALANGEFGRVLTSNRIAVEPSPPPRDVVSQLAAAGIQLLPVDNRRDSKKLALAPEDSFRLRSSTTDKTESLGRSFLACNTGTVLPKSDDEVEFVLVDAAAPVVERCLADLNGDTSNFLRLKVESADTLQQTQRSLANTPDPAYQIQQRRVEPLLGYSRGRGLAEAAPQPPTRGKNAVVDAADALSKPRRLKKAPAAAGRAYRFVTLADDQAGNSISHSRGEPLVSAGSLRSSGASAIEKAISDRVQILFVLESSGDN